MHLRVTTLALVALSAAANDWPQWRGPDLNGISRETGLPLRWSPEENIAWKLAMPSFSGSTPAIWGERIFVNVVEGDDLYIWCVDRARGALVWKRRMGGGNQIMRKQNMSSPSPVTDGKHVWMMTGTGILKGFDFDGNELWARDIQKDYGRFGLNHGYGSSPLLWEDGIYVQVLHGMKTTDPSYVLRIDKMTGKTVWRVERPHKAIHESPDSYCTPALLRYRGKTEIVINGADTVTGHDPATGRELWRGNGFNPDNNPANRIIASPVAYDGVVYAPTRIRPLQAFRAGGRGDITQSHHVFSFQNGPDVPTPVIDGKYFYSIGDKGIAWCLDARTGKEIYGGKRIRNGTYSSSPILADGRIYITSEDGVTTVLKAGPEFEILAENNLNDYCLSTTAISGGQIFLRTTKHLWCIGKRAER
ncbi:MAG: PQQ-like beta-propeller repeat protein [Acidobacteria bacterium]|nr:PQQ-like beta-propeller repeat protein [Acidobacteriota bacterium]